MDDRYINIPLSYEGTEKNVQLNRQVADRIRMLDNLVELIVFTPRGSFQSDPDFGFEYWNHEYSNVHFRDFDNGQFGLKTTGLYSELTKKKCQDSIQESLAVYMPELKRVEVQIEIGPVSAGTPSLLEAKKKKVQSKYYVKVCVTGVLKSDLGTDIPYQKEIAFLMEPTVKHCSI